MEFVQSRNRQFRQAANRPRKNAPDYDSIAGKFTRPLYLAFVTETWRPDINGVAISCGKIVDGLHGLGAKIQLIQPVLESADAEPQYDVRTVGGFRLPFYPDVTAGVSSKQKLAQIWSAERPDLVVIVTEGLLGRSALQVAKKMNIPSITEYHTHFQLYGKHYGVGFMEPVIRRYLRRFHNNSRVTLVPTEEIRQELNKQGYHNVVTLARGVDTELFDPNRRSEQLRRRWGLEPDQLAVIHVGRMAAEKNIQLAVKTFRRIQQVNPRARFILVGDGPLRKQLETENPDFVFCGMQDGEQLAVHYASADLFLFPSMTETFGNVLLEAMASALPVVCFDYAAAKRYVHDHYNGRKVAYGYEPQFITTAMELANNQAVCRSIGNYARVSVMNHGWESIYRKFAGVVEGVVNAEDAA
ncbi:MAG: glycosyltransferase family 1 protein [Gammaproteobacteria bacterium]|nr:glycosyltransferase family 1 protein [Gammaproteobacteria bacterium]